MAFFATVLGAVLATGFDLVAALAGALATGFAVDFFAAVAEAVLRVCTGFSGVLAIVVLADGFGFATGAALGLTGVFAGAALGAAVARAGRGAASSRV